MIIVTIIIAIIAIIFLALYLKALKENRSVTAQLTTHKLEQARLNERLAFAQRENERLQQARDEDRNEAKAELEQQRQLQDQKLAEQRQQQDQKLAEQRQQLMADYERERQRMAAEAEQRFNLLARDILDSNTKKFSEQSQDRLGAILNPLKEEIDRLKKSVNDTYSTEARERFALGERIKELVELNNTISREAKDLTRALRGDSKVQGDWGEMILETILEKSGLIRGIHFELQVTTDADGNTIKDSHGRMLRPDAVINYPDGRCVVVDSKVSLTDYVELVNCDPSTPQYQEAAKGHLQSVRSHIKELATKKYQDYIGDKQADFVAMFIPNEGAYMAAMNLAPSLWQEAYDQRVLIVSPTHLLTFLRLAEQMWRQDDMKRNVIEIATESGKMYDKFVGFVDDMGRIKKGLEQADAAYSEAMGKLSVGKGNLVRKAEQLKKLGAKATKTLPPSLTAASDDEP